MPHKYPYVSKITGLGEVDFYRNSDNSYTMIVKAFQKVGGGPIIKKKYKGDWEVYKGGVYAEYNSIINSILKKHEEVLKNKQK